MVPRNGAPRRTWPIMVSGTAGQGRIRPPRSPRWPDAGGCQGLEDDLLAVVLLVLEDLEAVFRLGERQGVGDDPGRVDLPALDAPQQRLHVPLHVALSGTQRQ